MVFLICSYELTPIFSIQIYPSSIVNVISRIIDQGLPLEKALHSPRVHPLEEGISLEIVDEVSWNQDDSTYFSQLGYTVEMKRLPGQFGRIHGVMLDTLTGEWIGCADPDWEGTAAFPNLE